RGIMSEAAGGPELTVVDAIDANLDLFLHRLRYRRHHMACDFTAIDHLGVGKPRGHVLAAFGRRKPTNMRGPDTRRTLLHARSSSKIVVPRATMSDVESRLVCRRAGPGLQRRKSTKDVQPVSGQASAAVFWFL